MEDLEITEYYFGDGEAFNGIVDSQEFVDFYKTPRDKYWTDDSKYSAIDRDGYWMPFDRFYNMVKSCDLGIKLSLIPGEKGRLYPVNPFSTSTGSYCFGADINVAHVVPENYTKSEFDDDQESRPNKIIVEKSFIKSIVNGWFNRADFNMFNRAVWFGLGKGEDGNARIFIQFGNDPTFGEFASQEYEEKYGPNFTNEGNSPVKVPPGR